MVDRKLTVLAALMVSAGCLGALGMGPAKLGALAPGAAPGPKVFDFASLRQAGIGEAVQVPGVRLDTGESLDLRLTRFEALAADAQIVVGTARGDRELPRPDVVLLRGTVAGELDSRVFVGVSSSGIHGFIERHDSLHFLSTGPFRANVDPARALRVTDAALLDVIDPAEFCGVTADAHELAPFGMPQAAGEGGAGDAMPGAPCRKVRLAIETDYEFTQWLFNGNTNASSAYVTTLVGALTEIYLRDVNTRFEIGFLRLWEQNNDPWNAGSTGAQLDQFRTYWVNNMGHVDRELAHFLSGRNLGGGVAYLSVVCSESFGYGVSANLNGWFPMPLQNNNSGNWDPYVTAHELGHNFGTIHTHDYSPPIDNCGNGNCQGANQGTIMSYCHLCSPGMANIRLEFHERVITTILDYLDGVGCNILDPDDCVVAALPTTFNVSFGTYQSGLLEDLFESDDQRLVVLQRAAVSPLLPVVRVDIQAQSPFNTASVLTTTLEASATALPANVPQQITLFSFDTFSYEQIDNRLATTNDSVTEVTIDSNAGRFVSGAGSILGRMNWFDPGNVLFASWTVRIDQAVWAVEP